MKNTSRTRTVFLLMLALLASGTLTFAQSTAFTYQGRLNDSSGPYTGNVEFHSSLWDAATAGNTVAISTPEQVIVAVTNGLFLLPLDFGAAPFTAGADRWLLLGLRTNVGSGPFVPLAPRQKLTATPYAITAGNLTGPLPASQLSGTLPSARLGGAYGNALTFGNAGNSFSGNGSGLTALNASQLTSGTVPDARLSASVARTSQVWLLGGNTGTTPGSQFLGTKDNQPLEIRVNGMRALRLEDNGDSGSDGGTIPDGAPNVVAGAPVNTVGAGIVGATISGGGAENFNGVSYPQTVLSDYATVGGGFGNRVAEGSYFGTIAGGYRNDLGLNSYYGVVGGGNNNNISDNSAYATIAGGYINDVGDSSGYSAIGGGRNNNIANSSGSAAIAGGYNNDIGTNSDYSAIGGGYDNNVADNSQYVTLAGGHRNNVGPSSFWSAIGGGSDNKVVGQTQHATIAGGYSNQVGVLSHYGAIGGGRNNQVEDGSWYATIAGGFQNHIGSNSYYASIGGGTNNTVGDGSVGSAIAGGFGNVIGDNTTNSVIGGGNGNEILDNAECAIIPGGSRNDATSFAFAAGRLAQAHKSGSFVWSDGSAWTYAYDSNSVNFRASGGYYLWSSMWESGVKLEPGSGSWTSWSDRNAKEEVEPVDPLEILGKVTSLPVATWKYKSQDASVRHIGPMAQDFKAAFGVGESDTGITTVDADGVALAAIQGLNEKVEAGRQRSEVRSRLLEEKLQQKETEITELKQSMNELKQLVEAMSHKLHGGAK